MISFNNFTWRKEWVNCAESPFSVLEKFKLANNITKSEIQQLFSKQNEIQKSHNLSKWNLLSLEAFNDTYLERILGFSMVTLNLKNIRRILAPFNINGMHYSNFFFKEFRYCEECLANSFHSLIHQFIFVNLCPFHLNKLRKNCPNCNSIYNFELQNNKPFRCLCGYNFLIRENKVFFHDWGKEFKAVDKEFVQYYSKNGTDLIYFDNKTLLRNEFSFDINLYELMDTDKTNYSITKRHSTNTMINTVNSYLEIYKVSKTILKAIARHIRKKLCKNHRKCIKEYVKNNPKFNFCPYALAYVEWRKDVEGLSSYSKVDNMYRKEIKPIDEFKCYSIVDNESMFKLYNYCKSVWNHIGNNHLVVEKLIELYLSKLLISRFYYYLRYFKNNRNYNRKDDFVNPALITQIHQTECITKIFIN